MQLLKSYIYEQAYQRFICSLHDTTMEQIRNYNILFLSMYVLCMLLFAHLYMLYVKYYIQIKYELV